MERSRFIERRRTVSMCLYTMYTLQTQYIYGTLLDSGNLFYSEKKTKQRRDF